VELDNRTIGNGRRGPVTSKLQTMFFDQVQGRKVRRPEWLTYVAEAVEVAQAV